MSEIGPAAHVGSKGQFLREGRPGTACLTARVEVGERADRIQDHYPEGVCLAELAFCAFFSKFLPDGGGYRDDR